MYFLLLIGWILLDCIKGVITKGCPLWILCNTRTGIIMQFVTSDADSAHRYLYILIVGPISILSIELTITYLPTPYKKKEISYHLNR